MMGCCQLGTDGADLRPRFRPLLLQGMVDLRTWRLPPLSRPTKDAPSKKTLLSHTPSSKKTDPKKVAMPNIFRSTCGMKVATKPNKAKEAKKLDDDADGEDEWRNIGAGPPSPSFRIFCQAQDQNGSHHAIEQTVSTCDAEETKKVKKEGKKMSMGSGMSGRKAGMAVKNLLNIKARSHPSTLPADDRRKVAA